MKGEIISMKTARIMADIEKENKNIKRKTKELYDFIKWHYEDNQNFFKNKGIGLNYPETDFVLKKLKTILEDNNERI